MVYRCHQIEVRSTDIEIIKKAHLNCTIGDASFTATFCCLFPKGYKIKFHGDARNSQKVSAGLWASAKLGELQHLLKEKTC